MLIRESTLPVPANLEDPSPTKADIIKVPGSFGIYLEAVVAVGDAAMKDWDGDAEELDPLAPHPNVATKHST